MTTETRALAICTPQIGTLSETFIRRHVQDLLPGRTVVITGTTEKPFAGHWTVECPMLVLDQLRQTIFQRAYRAAVRKLGFSEVGNTVVAEVTQFLKKFHVQIILGEYLSYSFPYFLIAQQLRIPYFVHGHGADVSEHLLDPQWQQNYLQYNDAAGIITMSQASRTRLIQLGLDAEKIYVIPYGVNIPEMLASRPEQKTIRCLAVGRMVAKKAPIFLLDVFRRAVAICPNLHLDYIGSGQLFPAAWQFVQALHLSEHVTLHKGQTNEAVHKFMQNADIFLQYNIIDPETGDEEGLPVSILEAMAHSLPVISTRHAGIPEAVVDGETGFLVEEDCPQKMTERLVTLAQNITLRQRMGRAGWQRAKGHFSWKHERNALLKTLNLNNFIGDHNSNNAHR